MVVLDLGDCLPHKVLQVLILQDKEPSRYQECHLQTSTIYIHINPGVPVSMQQDLFFHCRRTLGPSGFP